MASTVIGKTFGTSKIEAQIGEGGMGTVYRGYQASIDRHVAVKLLPANLLHDPDFLSRFTAEARALARLSHPAILPIYEYGEAYGAPYIVMPLMTGGSFNDRLANGPLALHDLLRFLTPIAEALDYAHKEKILHRDVKPRNILFDHRDSPFLADFGLAQFIRPTQTIGEISGTPAYMSPEQGRGERLDARADVYALGVVVYEALVGRLPFHSRKPMKLVLKHINEPPPRPKELRPEISAAVEEIILKALAKKPDERYQTTGEFFQALSNAAFLSRGFWRPAARDAQPTPPPQFTDSDSSITYLDPAKPAPSTQPMPPQPGIKVVASPTLIADPSEDVSVPFDDSFSSPRPPVPQTAGTHGEATLIASADEMDQIPDFPDPFAPPLQTELKSKPKRKPAPKLKRGAKSKTKPGPKSKKKTARGK